MYRRLGVKVAWIATAWLVAAQLLLPTTGVAHAHELTHGTEAAGRWSVHSHGAGLPHGHTPASRREQSPDDAGFRDIGRPVATLRSLLDSHDLVPVEKVVPPGASRDQDAGSARAFPDALAPREFWRSHTEGSAASPPPAPCRSRLACTGTFSLRGPPDLI